MSVIDCDQHLFETPDLWRRYSTTRDASLALSLDTDRLGHTWLTWQGGRIAPAFHQIPGDTESIGRQMTRIRRGEPAEISYDEATPPEYTDPAARLAHLDRQEVDAAWLFPNYGLLWERALRSDLHATKLNMEAWNRWAVEVAQQGRGRLLPVAHLTLRDPAWLDGQLATLAAAGIRTAMVAPALVGGRRLSHPDLHPVWSAFEHHGVSPVFHVSDVERPFADAWVDDDPDPGNPVLGSVFLSLAPALALADLAVHGVFERHPGLRIGVIELSAIWVPMFLLTLDGGSDFHARFNGAPLTELPLRPSEYIRRQVRVAAFSYERPDRLIERAGELFMFCSDYPHSEGTDTALDDYQRACPGAGDPVTSPALFGGNAAWLTGA